MSKVVERTSRLLLVDIPPLEVPRTFGTEDFEDRMFTERVFYGHDIPATYVLLPATTADTYQVRKHGTPREIFDDLGEDRLRWDPSQVVVFVRHNYNFLSELGGVSVFGLETRVVMMRFSASGFILRALYYDSTMELKFSGGGGMRVFLLSS